MTYTKGGRGVRAPYESTHARIPAPLKETVQALSKAYAESLNVETALESLVKVERSENLLTDNPTKLLTSNEAIELAKTILVSKKSARVSLTKLLTAIYGEEIVL